MTNAELTSLLQCLGVLSCFLLIGTFLRAKVKFFQKLLLPASVIGGFLALLVGPIFWGPSGVIKTSFVPLNFSGTWLTTWANLPGVLIVPIFAAVPLGLFMSGKKQQGGAKRGVPKILMTLGLFAVAGCAQNILGFSTNLIYNAAVPGADLYPLFGYEMSQGFTGGHGTAAAIGPLFTNYGFEYAGIAQGVGVTFATFGLVGGMLLGILFINIAQRRGKTTLLNKGGTIPKEISTGINKDIKKQASLGRETTTSSSIETIALHVALLLLACLSAYGIKALLAMGYGIPGLGTVFQAFDKLPVWFWALLCMYAINGLLILFKLNWMVDTKVKSRITGTLTDFAVTAAIASLDILAVAAYIVPILILCVLGFIVTYLIIFPLSKVCFGDDHPFERGIMSWGVNTGVMITGMMLLKICDPDYETPVLADFSIGFSSASLFTIFLSFINYMLISQQNTVGLLLFNIGQFTLFGVITIVGTILFRKANRSIAAQQAADAGE